jgi:hypothetical protein
MVGYTLAPQIITKTCSPWIMSSDERVSFVCRSITPWSLDMVEIKYEGPSANLHVDHLSVDFDLEKLIEHKILDDIKIQQIAIIENKLNPSDDRTTDFANASANSKKTWQEEILNLEIPIQIRNFSIAEMQIFPAETPAITIENIEANCDQSNANVKADIESLGGMEVTTKLNWSGHQLSVNASLGPAIFGHRKDPLLALNSKITLMPEDVIYDIQLQGFSIERPNQPTFVMKGQGTLNSHAWELLSSNTDQRFPNLQLHWSEKEPQRIHLKKDHEPVGQLGWGQSSVWFQPHSAEKAMLTEKKPQPFIFQQTDSAWSTTGIIPEMVEEGVWRTSQLDYSIPLTSESENGWLKGQIEIEGLDTLDFSFVFSAQPRAYKVTGNIQWQNFSLPEIPLSLELNDPLDTLSKKPWFSAKIELPSQELSIFTDEFGLPAGHLSAEIEGDVEVSYSPTRGFVERAEFSWKDGFYSSEDMGTMLDGLSGKIDSPALSLFKTGSAQEFRWNKVNTEGFTIDAGVLFWQWEQEQRLFVESMRAEWCGGVLNLQPFRVELPLDHLKLVLFCEGIELDQLLKQFQVGDVEGDGDLGGRLSLELNGDKISFDDAYLYTAPAREGSLKILEAQGLDQAMEQNQLQLVRHSLKDYRYRWAKISFDAEDEDLVLKLQMDGRPAGLLPFRFDTNTAQFIYDPASPGVDLQGLKLNTNFRSAQLWPMILSSLKWAQQMELGTGP